MVEEHMNQNIIGITITIDGDAARRVARFCLLQKTSPLDNPRGGIVGLVCRQDKIEFRRFVYADGQRYGFRFSDGSEIEDSTAGWTDDVTKIVRQTPGIEIRNVE